MLREKRKREESFNFSPEEGRGELLNVISLEAEQTAL